MRFLPHIIYSVALTSISYHLLVHKKTAEAQKAQLTARISILESIIQSLRSDNLPSDVEIERLKKLARAHDIHAQPPATLGGIVNEKVNWRDVFLGRKRVSANESEWDAKDLDKGAWRYVSSFSSLLICRLAHQEIENAS
jgi:hypothetical protein